ncbi:MAG: pyrroloquinoline quinone biosynthesis protein PqqE [Roseobacter sp.]|uniref:pyrroloquinoline quinone biosynthesis protein PqqE n=1 Tax=Tateyamaria sp. TaxID=1929288 RepID=UPI00327068F7
MTKPAPPIAMLAELTHVCPLACPYCSNPLELTKRSAELDTETWGRVFRESADLGVLQIHLSGGEPASRRDLVELVVAAREAGLYTNLITSGIGLTEDKLSQLDAAGLDHIQLSLQGITAELADRIGGYKGGFDRKMHVAERIAAVGFPLTLNAVMHRHNLDDLPATIALAERLGARRVEVACVQFHGWAEANRGQLQPTDEQVRAAKATVDGERDRMKGRIVIDFVAPDWFADFPKACMGGWGSTGLNITPDGNVLPCHAAESIPSLTFANVNDQSLTQIWYEDAAFNAFRGTEWMPALCQTCERRDIDFAGCRCQAMAVLGDASATDPVCRKSPGRAAVDALLEAPVSEEPFVYRVRV